METNTESYSLVTSEHIDVRIARLETKVDAILQIMANLESTFGAAMASLEGSPLMKMFGGKKK